MLDLLVVLVLLVDSKQNETVTGQSRFFRKKNDEYLYLSKNCSIFALAMQKVALINKL